jgi:hypothetical protein
VSTAERAVLVKHAALDIVVLYWQWSLPHWNRRSKMLQETHAPQQYAESGASVALHQHSGLLSEPRLSDQEQADSFVASLVLVLTPNGGEVLTVDVEKLRER